MAMERTALTVLSDAVAAPLSPFFAKARRLLFVDLEANRRLLLFNREMSADWIVDQICAQGISRAVFGFVTADALLRLNEAGVDTRLGPCSVPAESLIERFHTLPSANTVVRLDTAIIP